MNLCSGNENPEIMDGKPLIYAGILTSIGALLYLSYNKLKKSSGLSENDLLQIQYNQIKKRIEVLSLEELEKKEIKKNSYIEDLILELKQLVIAHEIERKFKQTNKKTQELLIMQNEQIVELENSRKIISLEKSPKKSNKIMSLEKCQEEGY
jgi:hypothetical protein